MNKDNVNSIESSTPNDSYDDTLDSFTEDEFDILKWLDDMDEPLDEDLIVITKEDELLDDISQSLAKQICGELDKDLKEDIPKKVGFKFFSYKTLKFASIGFISIFLAMVILIITPFGREILIETAANYAHGKMTYNDGSEVVIQEVKDDVIENVDSYDPESIKDAQVSWNTAHADDGARWEEGVVNILLLGEEAIESGGGRGRTDLMIIATMNTKSKKVKLTSLMRDVLVQIPGYKDNKLNASYEIGGIPLLYETIELNFDVKLDGYVLVGFEDFEAIINKLGGVSITLTQEEANYLNTTNYISKPQYRNVKAGTHILNGNQALGYCRIRYVATGDKELNDYGRTSRQRVLLNAIFEQYKSKNLAELIFMLNDILPLITTDIDSSEIEEYLKLGVTMGLSSIENLRIPIDNSFEEGYVRKMSVLIPDLEANIEKLHSFIFDN